MEPDRFKEVMTSGQGPGENPEEFDLEAGIQDIYRREAAQRRRRRKIMIVLVSTTASVAAFLIIACLLMAR